MVPCIPRSCSQEERGVRAAVSGHLAVDPLALWSSRIEARHGGVRTAFVHEDEKLGVYLPRLFSPANPLFLVTLGGREGLFLSGSPSLSKARLMVAVETAMPLCSSKSSQCSARVRSGLRRTWAGSLCSSAPRLRAGGPGTGLDSTSPVSRRSRR